MSANSDDVLIGVPMATDEIVSLLKSEGKIISDRFEPRERGTKVLGGCTPLTGW